MADKQELETTPPPVAPKGLYRDTTALSEGFQAAMRSANVLTPVVRIDFIPPMHSISLRVVWVNPDPKSFETYLPDEKKQDEVALGKTALDKICAAAGISWHPTLSGRLDDGSDSHYCRFRAVGWITDFDGGRRQICAEKEIDLRNGSSTITNWSPKRLAMAREHIQAMAESKAKNRAIRGALAIKSKYHPSELAKPFIVPKLVFTGETDDPVMRRVIAEKMADRALGVTGQLYGPEPGAQDALDITPQQAPAIATSPPPPVSGGTAEAPAAATTATTTPTTTQHDPPY